LVDITLGIQPAVMAQIEYGKELAHSGAITEAMNAFDIAIVISPTLNITNTLSMEDWLQVCVKGIEDEIASVVLPACERAVEVAPVAESRFLRGLARAFTGSAEGVIEDLEFVLAQSKEENIPDEIVTIIEEALIDLQAGKDPVLIVNDMLEKLGVRQTNNDG
jgi:hypothetical protein